MTPDPEARDVSFKSVLNLLLHAQAKPDPHRPGQFIEPTNPEIADAINAKHGPGTITSETVRRLRNGIVKSPSIQIASLLADFFQLPLDVFNAVDSETSKKVVGEVQRFIDSRRRTLSENPETPTVAVLARTTRRLSPDGQQRVVRFAAQLEQLEAMETEASEGAAPTSD